MDPLVPCLAQKGSIYLDNGILEIRLPKTVIFVKCAVSLTYSKIDNEIVIFERLNNFDRVKPD